MSDIAPEFTPRPLSKRSLAVLVVIAIVVGILYFLVAHFYNAEGGVIYTKPPMTTSDGGLLVSIDPESIASQANIATVRLSFAPLGPNLVDGTGHLTKNLRITLDGWAGTREVKFAAGSKPTDVTEEAPLTGELAEYPFDTHQGAWFIEADTYDKNADGTFASTGEVFVVGEVVSGVGGWDTSATLESSPGALAVNLAFNRAFSTQAFALLLLALATLLSAAAVVVAFLVATMRRRAEISLITWTAALIFALPALRTFMPNSPPIGAAIDMYLYLWVMAGAVAASITIILAWIRQSGRELEAARLRREDGQRAVATSQHGVEA